MYDFRVPGLEAEIRELKHRLQAAEAKLLELEPRLRHVENITYADYVE